MGLKEELQKFLNGYKDDDDTTEPPKETPKEETTFTEEQLQKIVDEKVEEAMKDNESKEEVETPKVYTQEEVDAAVQAELAKRSKAAPPSTPRNTTKHATDKVEGMTMDQKRELWKSGEAAKLLEDVTI